MFVPIDALLFLREDQTEMNYQIYDCKDKEDHSNHTEDAFGCS